MDHAKPTALEKRRKTDSQSDDSVTNSPTTNCSAPSPAGSGTTKMPPKPPKVPTKTTLETAPKRKPPSDTTSAVPAKMPRNHVTAMKDLLQKGGALLMQAADSLLVPEPQTEVPVRLASQLKEMDYKLKIFQDHVSSVLQTIKTSMTTLATEVKMRFETTETNSAGNATTSEMSEASLAQTTRWDEIHADVKTIKEQLEQRNFQKLSFEINLLQGRLDAMQSRIALLPIADTTRAPAEPAPRRSEADRLQQRLEATKSALAQVRNDTKKIAAEIEEHEAQRSEDEPLESRTLDELREKRSRLREREATLEKEMCGLERRIRNDTKEREERSGETSRRREEHHRREDYERPRDDRGHRNPNRAKEDRRSSDHRRSQHEDEEQVRRQVPSIVIRPAGV
ncbi:hypothetical protein Q1695_008614 [Nippostrongylus brasiliensis]|nr:hypothetical protein Q1695_008614 [Nippostrongylus brasiliensis]